MIDTMKKLKYVGIGGVVLFLLVMSVQLWLISRLTIAPKDVQNTQQSFRAEVIDRLDAIDTKLSKTHDLPPYADNHPPITP